MMRRLSAILFACAMAANLQADDAQRLHQLFEEQWEHRLRTFPQFASWLGDRRFNDRWGDAGLEAQERWHERSKQVLQTLAEIDPAQLSPTDRVNYKLFKQRYETSVRLFPYGWGLIPLNQREGVQTLDDFAQSLRFETVKDYDDWLARLNTLPEYIDQTIAVMREGIRRKIVHPKVIIEKIPEQVAKQIVDDPVKSPFFKKFKEIPPSFDEATNRRLVDEAKSAISMRVVPAYRKLQKFLNDEYLPAGYDRVGVWQVPRGKQLYAQLARKFTTTQLTPEEIHKIGLREVERIRGEMRDVIKQVGFEGTFDEFFEHLRTDPKFYFSKPEQLLDATRALCKRIDPHLVKLFKTLPRTPYGVKPIPSNIAPYTTTAYYNPPAADGSRAGNYFVNLYKPQVRPKFEMEALSLHEAVPGHHLQIALAMELEGLPKFRRYEGYTAFVEGWGLYSERLGDQLGCYQDPYSKFGQLTYEMWRAVRLVVDTGMHHFGWTRERAIDFFKANAPKTEHDIINEIDRYIAWPGQALAYKIGELRINALRSKATEALGNRFDIREFHDVVLGSGAVTLDVLEVNVNAWIQRQSQVAE